MPLTKPRGPGCQIASSSGLRLALCPQTSLSGWELVGCHRLLSPHCPAVSAKTPMLVSTLGMGWSEHNRDCDVALKLWLWLSLLAEGKDRSPLGLSIGRPTCWWGHSLIATARMGHPAPQKLSCPDLVVCCATLNLSSCPSAAMPPIQWQLWLPYCCTCSRGHRYCRATRLHELQLHRRNANPADIPPSGSLWHKPAGEHDLQGSALQWQQRGQQQPQHSRHSVAISRAFSRFWPGFCSLQLTAADRHCSRGCNLQHGLVWKLWCPTSTCPVHPKERMPSTPTATSSISVTPAGGHEGFGQR